MPLSRIVDGHVITEADFEAKADEITEHLAARAKSTVAALPLSKNVALVGTPTAFADASTARFTAIGPKLPLTVNIEHVYTGKFPERAFLTSHRGDMAIFSGVRNFSLANVTARAVNYLEPGVAPHSHFLAPTVFNQGTSLILYSPAVIEAQITITFEMTQANSFNRELLDKVGSAFQALGQLPLLLPYSGYLLGAGSLIKLGEGLTDVLYQATPPFLRTEVIRMSGPGTPAVASWRVIHNSSLDITGLSFDETQGLIDKTGKQYDGDEPYVIISLDGAKNDDLKGFTPAIASAAQLQTFLGMKDNASAVIDTLVGAVSLYSDIRYRDKAEKVKAELDDPNTPASEKDDLQKQFAALIKNINDPALKLK